MKPYLLVLLAAFLWGIVGVLTTGVLQEGVAALEIAFWRALIAGAIFLIHGLLRREVKLEKSKDTAILVGFGFLGVTIFFSAYNMAIEQGGISLAVVLLYTAPFFVVILARIFLKERITLRKSLAVFLVLLGVSLVAIGGTGAGIQVTSGALFWGLVAGFGYGSYYIVGKVLLQRHTPLGIYAISFPIGALGLLPFVQFAPKSLYAWGFILLLAFFSTYLSNLIYMIGLKNADASKAVLVASLEPVIAAILAAIFFGELFGPLGLVGAALVVLASVVGVVKVNPRFFRKTL